MTNNNSLWDKTKELEWLEDQMHSIDIDEELSEEEKETKRELIFQQWLIAEGDWETKIESCGYAVKCLEKENQAIASMIDDLKARKKNKEGQIKRLKRYMLNAMQNRNKTKIKGSYSTIYTQTYKPVILNCEPEELPQEYQRVKVEPNMTELKKALKRAEQTKEGFTHAYFGLPQTSLIIRIK